MCLLKPTNGRLLIDGLDIHDTRNPKDLLSWQASIAHVPQSIFLSDASVAENIAFGTPASEIDFDRVKWAAQLANISHFIEGTSDGYSTFVGERGVRLSGGQLQRIGIARALYKNASILIFDEATSALDNSTEDSVMTAIDSLDDSLTVVMVAHRISTLQNCDRIISIEKGVVVKNGPPNLVLE